MHLLFPERAGNEGRNRKGYLRGSGYEPHLLESHWLRGRLRIHPNSSNYILFLCFGIAERHPCPQKHTGKFDPAKSDLVFSQKGELLGIMGKNNYAFHVKNLGSRLHAGSRTVLDNAFEAEKTNSLLASLGKKLFGLQNKFR